MQNCDGVYPVVGHIRTHTFDQVFRAGVEVRLGGCATGCRNVNDVLDEARAPAGGHPAIRHGGVMKAKFDAIVEALKDPTETVPMGHGQEP